MFVYIYINACNAANIRFATFHITLKGRRRLPVKRLIQILAATVVVVSIQVVFEHCINTCSSPRKEFFCGYFVWLFEIHVLEFCNHFSSSLEL